MKMFKKLNTQKGEIATALTIISLGVMALGALVGTRIQQSQTLKQQTRAQTPVCIDHDENLGKPAYYYKASSAEGKNGVQNDVCKKDWIGPPNSKDIVERICDSASGYVKNQIYTCPNGCSNGACIDKQPSPTPIPPTVRPTSKQSPKGEPPPRKPMPTPTSTVTSSTVKIRTLVDMGDYLDCGDLIKISLFEIDTHQDYYKYKFLPITKDNAISTFTNIPTGRYLIDAALIKELPESKNATVGSDHIGAVEITGETYEATLVIKPTPEAADYCSTPTPAVPTSTLAPRPENPGAVMAEVTVRMGDYAGCGDVISLQLLKKNPLTGNFESAQLKQLPDHGDTPIEEEVTYRTNFLDVEPGTYKLVAKLSISAKYEVGSAQSGLFHVKSSETTKVPVLVLSPTTAASMYCRNSGSVSGNIIINNRRNIAIDSVWLIQEYMDTKKNPTFMYVHIVGNAPGIGRGSFKTSGINLYMNSNIKLALDFPIYDRERHTIMEESIIYDHITCSSGTKQGNSCVFALTPDNPSEEVNIKITVDSEPSNISATARINFSPGSVQDMWINLKNISANPSYLVARKHIVDDPNPVSGKSYGALFGAGDEVFKNTRYELTAEYLTDQARTFYIPVEACSGGVSTIGDLWNVCLLFAPGSARFEDSYNYNPEPTATPIPPSPQPTPVCLDYFAACGIDSQPCCAPNVCRKPQGEDVSRCINPPTPPPGEPTQPPAPTCLPDGWLCSSGNQCCSGECHYGQGGDRVCGRQITPTPPSPTPTLPPYIPEGAQNNNVLKADFNGDGVVNLNDWSQAAQNYGTQTEIGEETVTVNSLLMSLILSNLGQTVK